MYVIFVALTGMVAFLDTICYKLYKSENRTCSRRFGRQGEWGEKPRESVTVMPPYEDESEYLRAVGVSAGTGKRVNTAAPLRRYSLLDAFAVCSGQAGNAYFI